MADTEPKPNVTPAKAEEPVVKSEDPAAAVDLPTKTEAPVEAPAKPEAAAEKSATTEASEAPAKSEGVETPANAEDSAKGKEPAKEVEAAAAELYAAQQAQGHSEIWGVTLQDPAHHVPSQIIFQKYLNANDGDLAKAKDQLTKTLAWRAETNPLETTKATWSKDKFDALGYVTTYRSDDGSSKEGNPESKEVFTWNVYGNVKDMDVTFGDRNEFLDWRVGLMELAMQELDLASATRPITADWDPYKIYQVHDYKSVSFLRQNAKVKAAVSETVKIFGQNYPELLKQKFFVNVPAIMGWLYAVVKIFVAERTAKKFHPMGNGANMSAEFADSKVPGLGKMLPKEYGGQGEALAVQGRQTLLE
ncbi:phosphatidylinositol transfer protein SFH5 [Apiospora rasikravindrae]|uniref:Phosphatidylinositol transfer protein SFH5 n=1 Tax=Apiospora rasikravindrae TaxID=990691 RepID=A0ABR1RQI8_9PEZI